MNFKSKEMRRLWSRLEKVYFNIEPTIQKTVQNNETYIVKKNAGQMFAGIRADNKPIKPDYAPATIAYKKRKRQPFNRVTLRDSGDFHFKHLKVIARRNDFVIDTSLSGTRPYGFLMKPNRYGEQILGLTPKNLDELANKKVIPAIEKLFKKLKK